MQREISTGAAHDHVGEIGLSHEREVVPDAGDSDAFIGSASEELTIYAGGLRPPHCSTINVGILGSEAYDRAKYCYA